MALPVVVRDGLLVGARLALTVPVLVDEQVAVAVEVRVFVQVSCFDAVGE